MKKLIYYSLILIALFTGCKKDNDDGLPPVNEGPVELRENVQVIDSTLMTLDLVASDFNNGTYVFNTSGTPPVVIVNDIIIGAEGDGFIRKITSVSTNGTVITYQTEQGTLEDVFKNGNFNFTIDMNDLNSGKTSGFSYQTDNVNLYQQGSSTIKLLNANVNFDPEWFFDFTFKPSGISYFELSTANTNYQATADVRLTSSGSISLIDETDTLTTFTKRIVKIIPVGGIPVPIVLRIKLYLMTDYSANVDGSLSSTANLTSSASNLEAGMKYENSQWTGIYNINPVTTLTITDITASLQTTFNYTLRPKVAVKINGVFGPNLTVGLNGKLTESIMTGNLWDLKAEGWIKTEAAADVTILGKTLANYNHDWETDHLAFQTPYSIQYISGTNQTGNAGTQLATPLKVRILDSRGQAQKNVAVIFAATSGGGSLSPSSILTDQNGYAESSWTIGPQAGIAQYATATAKFGDGNLLNSAPVEFSATDVAGLPLIINDTVLSVSAFAATLEAEVTTDGGSPVTERGFCYVAGYATPTINDTRVVSGNGTGSFSSVLNSLLPATLYSFRAYATNSVGTIYSDLNFFATKGTWYAGTYTLTPGNGNYSNCGTQQGDEGECYFYIASGRNITFARSVISQMPDIWHNSPLYNGDEFRIINQEQYSPGYYSVFEFDWLQIHAGDSIRDIGFGLARYELPCDDPQICEAGCLLFQYGISVSADYVGENPPGGLSPAEVQQMIDFY